MCFTLLWLLREGYQLKATGWTAGLPAWRDDVLFCMKGDQFQEHTWNDHL